MSYRQSDKRSIDCHLYIVRIAIWLLLVIFTQRHPHLNFIAWQGVTFSIRQSSIFTMWRNSEDIMSTHRGWVAPVIWRQNSWGQQNVFYVIKWKRYQFDPARICAERIKRLKGTSTKWWLPNHWMSLLLILMRHVMRSTGSSLKQNNNFFCCVNSEKLITMSAGSAFDNIPFRRLEICWIDLTTWLRLSDFKSSSTRLCSCAFWVER